MGPRKQVVPPEIEFGWGLPNRNRGAKVLTIRPRLAPDLFVYGGGVVERDTGGGISGSVDSILTAGGCDSASLS